MRDLCPVVGRGSRSAPFVRGQLELPSQAPSKRKRLQNERTVAPFGRMSRGAWKALVTSRRGAGVLSKLGRGAVVPS